MDYQCTILVIEDDAAFRESLRKALLKHDFKVLEAASSGEGMALLEAYPVDLVILDLYLGDKSGIEFLKETKTAQRPPVIMLTAFGDFSAISAAIEEGAADCVAKPIKRDVLLGMIYTILQKHGKSCLQSSQDDLLYDRLQRSAQLDDLLHTLYKAEEEEEADIYLLDLYLHNSDDLTFFSMAEQEKIEGLMGRLKEDTLKHSRLLKEVINELEGQRPQE